MVDTTLVDLRGHVEALASDDGEYYVVCGRTGDRPVPVADLRFDRRATARSAALAAEQYRTVLRRYDPQVPHYDLIVCQDAERVPPEQRAQRDGGEAYPETLSEAGYEAVETAVMEAYFDLAGTVADPDDLCLRLLENAAGELDRRLSPTEQAEVLAGAATRLAPTDSTDRPVATTLSVLEERGLLGSYSQSPWSVDLHDGTRSVVVRFSEYALAPGDGRLPVLPIVLEVYRRQPDWPPSSLRVVDADEGWRLTLVMAREAEPSGLASAPIDPEV